MAFGIKYIMDGLVEGGKLENDNLKWVKSITHKFILQRKQNPKIIVCLHGHVI
jgi:hypothetical protein